VTSAPADAAPSLMALAMRSVFPVLLSYMMNMFAIWMTLTSLLNLIRSA
jgi:hypothetical protein